jgi:uncharacterized repeat protein (TIGR01451 family)
MKTRHLLFALALGLGLALAVLVGLGGNLPRARAATYTVTNTNASGPGSLRQAILDANGNTGHDTIDFSTTGAIVLTDALPAILDDLTITGPGVEQLAVSGANAYRVFAINDGAAVTITRVTVQDGSATYGGGVFVYQGSATLSGMQVVSNSANSGGGVFVWNGSATLNGVQVANNSASTYGGGGVYVYQGSVTLSGTQMVSNSAAYYGGGVYVDRGSATLGVSGGAIDSNSASAGGGVYVHQGSTTLSETLVIRNSAVYSGGGVYVGQGSATLSGTQVVSNSASPQTHGCGGGVYVEQGSATLNGTQVVRNSASYNGGGLYLSSSTGAITATDGCIVYNSDTAVDNDSTGTLNARDNWWGMPDGPSGVGPGSGDSVSAYVDYANFKTSPPAGCPAYRPDLTIAKSVTPTTDAAYHGAVTYTVRLNNSGWLSDTNVLFTDTLPSEVDFGAFVGADHGASVDDDELTWAGTVTTGEALTWTFTALHTGSYGDVVTNAAEFSGALQAGDDDVVFTVVEPHTIFLPLVLRNN